MIGGCDLYADDPALLQAPAAQAPTFQPLAAEPMAAAPKIPVPALDYEPAPDEYSPAFEPISIERAPTTLIGR